MSSDHSRIDSAWIIHSKPSLSTTVSVELARNRCLEMHKTSSLSESNDDDRTKSAH